MTQLQTRWDSPLVPRGGLQLQLGWLVALLLGLSSACQQEFFLIREPVLAAVRSGASLPRDSDLGIPVHRVDSQVQQASLADLRYGVNDLRAGTPVVVQATEGSVLTGQILLASRSDLFPNAAPRSEVAVVRLTERAGPPAAVKLGTLDLAGAGPPTHGQVLVRGRAFNDEAAKAEVIVLHAARRRSLYALAQEAGEHLIVAGVRLIPGYEQSRDGQHGAPGSQELVTLQVLDLPNDVIFADYPDD